MKQLREDFIERLQEIANSTTFEVGDAEDVFEVAEIYERKHDALLGLLRDRRCTDNKEMRFGNWVEFDQEYRSDSTYTVDVYYSSTKEVFNKFEEREVEPDEPIIVKVIHEFKNKKKGIYVGTLKIHTELYYDYRYNEYNGDYFTPVKCGFVEVAEIRCEGIKKTYYVPMDNVRWLE